MDLLQPGTLHVPHQYTVHILGQSAHLDLPETGLQDVIEFLPCDLLLPQQPMHLFQQFHHQPVNLLVLLGPHQIPRILKVSRHGSQFLLCPVVIQKIIELVHIHRRQVPPAALQRRKLVHHPLPQRVDPLQRLFLLPHLPGFSRKKPVPFFQSPDPRLPHIIFQIVYLLRFQRRQTTAQIVKHRLIGKILQKQL